MVVAGVTQASEEPSVVVPALRHHEAPIVYEFRVVGAARMPLRDFYHALLQFSWPMTMAFIALGYGTVNLLFALAYYATGGIQGSRPGSLADAFYFSVETMGTIGYGSMYPATDAANVMMVIQSTVSLVLTALATGLVFAKFSRPTARVLFSRCLALSPMNGVPTLSFRIGNQRRNRIVEAQLRVAFVRTERTLEGKDFYRTSDVKLVRDRLQLQRSWNVMHVIDETSPLYGATPASLEADGAEILVSVTGLDDTWMQTVHATHRYAASQIAWGYRMADVLSEQGTIVTLDLTKFHELEPAEPLPTFPYPRG
jgi:inward rectifier potassium channel